MSTVDIVPSILGHVGLPLPRGLPGRSFLAPARGGSEERIFAQYGGSRFAVRTPAWKLIASPSGRLELYDLARDPGERQNLADVKEEVRERLRGALQEWKAQQRPLAQTGPELALDAEEIERLRALGYLGGN